MLDRSPFLEGPYAPVAEEITAFVNEATEGDYNHLISTVGNWVSIS